MFKRILIANRGEIACRVIKTAREMGIETVAVFSDADRDARHVSMADKAIYIGPAPARDSYLMVDKIIDAALQTKAEAIHPGYGFLSENPVLPEACAKHNITFIGPPTSAIEAMGSKAEAKSIMADAGVPLVPGYHGADNRDETLIEEAKRIGYPLLLKAALGGGGKGMRVVESDHELPLAIQSAKREALSSFGSDQLLIEKYLLQPRHVEIQIFADSQGHTLYFADRDCSIQRRHQKVIEEAPAPFLQDELRQQMGEAAVAAAKAIGYVGAGTVEFLVDAQGEFYFMEMNTRLQVEHPVTEMVTGLDLVRLQLLVASGESLNICQSDVVTKGHALEVRIYAEDPETDFLPASGTIHYLREPEQNKHVRIDTGVCQGDEISTHYDPMIAKLVVWDENRNRAIQRLSKALKDYHIQGLKTNLSFLSRLNDHPSFIRGDLETGFIEEHADQLLQAATDTNTENLLLSALYVVLYQQQKQSKRAKQSQDRTSPWHNHEGWLLNQPSLQTIRFRDEAEEYQLNVVKAHAGYQIEFDEQQYACFASLEDDVLTVDINGYLFTVNVRLQKQTITIFNENHSSQIEWIKDRAEVIESNQQNLQPCAPMNGTIVEVLAEVGMTVEAGQGLIVMEAMKMEYTINAPHAALVQAIYCQPGDLVEDSQALAELEFEV